MHGKPWPRGCHSWLRYLTGMRNDVTRSGALRTHRGTIRILATLLGVATVGLVHAQDDGPAVVPYRPSVATPADLPAPGWPELEAGVQWAKGGDTARSFSAPVTFKLAWSERWGVVIGTDAYDWQRNDDGSTAHSIGDTSVNLKFKLPINDTLALGLQGGPTLPTASSAVGSGKTDWGINAIASLDYPAIHVDLNAAAVRLGSVDEGQGRTQGVWAVAASHPLNDRFGVTGEVSGVVQRGASPQAQGLAALSYNVSRALVLDIAVAAGLTHGAPDWQILTGMTVRLGHWF